jgi:hypothetical protein
MSVTSQLTAASAEPALTITIIVTWAIRRVDRKGGMFCVSAIMVPPFNPNSLN